MFNATCYVQILLLFGPLLFSLAPATLAMEIDPYGRKRKQEEELSAERETKKQKLTTPDHITIETSTNEVLLPLHVAKSFPAIDEILKGSPAETNKIPIPEITAEQLELLTRIALLKQPNPEQSNALLNNTTDLEKKALQNAANFLDRNDLLLTATSASVSQTADNPHNDNLIFVTKDNDEVIVPREIARCFPVINDMMNDIVLSDNRIPVPDLTQFQVETLVRLVIASKTQNVALQDDILHKLSLPEQNEITLAAKFLDSTALVETVITLTENTFNVTDTEFQIPRALLQYSPVLKAMSSADWNHNKQTISLYYDKISREALHFIFLYLNILHNANETEKKMFNNKTSYQSKFLINNVPIMKTLNKRFDIWTKICNLTGYHDSNELYEIANNADFLGMSWLGIELIVRGIEASVLEALRMDYDLSDAWHRGIPDEFYHLLANTTTCKEQLISLLQEIIDKRSKLWSYDPRPLRDLTNLINKIHNTDLCKQALLLTLTCNYMPHSVKEYTILYPITWLSTEMDSLTISKLEFLDPRITDLDGLSDIPGIQHLKYLNLSDNNIYVISDNAFAGLTSLEDLNLSYCRINSIKAQAFAMLTNLKRLSLQGNIIANREKFLEELKTLLPNTEILID